MNKRIHFILNDLGLLKRNKYRQRVLAKLYLSQAGKCYWCSCQTLFRVHNHPRQSSIDHLKTKFQGRKTFSDGGYVMACYSCNQKRGREEYKEFKKLSDKIKQTQRKLWALEL
jgi:hypothetical protein